MLLRSVISAIVMAGSLVHACTVMPENAYGVCLNDNEPVDAGIIETIGEEGVNYYKNDKVIGTVYSFRGSYDPSNMVSVVTAFDSIVLNGDTLVPNRWTNMVYVTIDPSTMQQQHFPFGSCIRHELDMLVSAGILDLSRAEREHIEQAITQWHADSHDGYYGYYWTLRDTVLQNNAQMDPDGVIERYRCGGGEVTVTLPPEVLNLELAGAVELYPKASVKSDVTAGSSHSEINFLDIAGRMIGREITGNKVNGQGIRLVIDRKSGIVKRVVRLP